MVTMLTGNLRLTSCVLIAEEFTYKKKQIENVIILPKIKGSSFSNQGN